MLGYFRMIFCIVLSHKRYPINLPAALENHVVIFPPAFRGVLSIIPHSLFPIRAISPSLPLSQLFLLESKITFPFQSAVSSSSSQHTSPKRFAPCLPLPQLAPTPLCGSHRLHPTPLTKLLVLRSLGTSASRGPQVVF